MSNARKLADNLPIDGHFGNRNIVINGNFTISQRGSYTSSTSVSDGTFYLDRWQYVEDGSPTSSLIHNTDGTVKITTGASVTGSSRLRQKFEYNKFPRQYDNQTFTVSAKVKSNSTNARINVYAGGYRSLTGTTAHSGGGSFETLTATFTTPSTISTEFSVHIGIDGVSSANVSITSGQYFEVKEVQMEVGPQSTPFEHEPYDTTLEKCQRYYQISGTGRTFGIVFNQFTATNAYANQRWWKLMRTAPTITMNSVSNYNIYNTGTSRSKSAVGISQLSENSGEFYITTGSLTQGTATHLNTNADTFCWKADAEL